MKTNDWSDGRRGWCAIWVVAGLLSWSGCAEDDRVTVRLSWTFEGLVDCASADIETVEVTANTGVQAVATFSCGDGEAPRFVTLDEYGRGIVHLKVVANSHVDGLATQFAGEARIEARSSPIDAVIVLSEASSP